MAINAQEISALIKQQIENFKPNFDVTETGVVTYIGDGIARAHGLPTIHPLQTDKLIADMQAKGFSMMDVPVGRTSAIRF